MPAAGTWNSEISGFHLQYWSQDGDAGSATTLGTRDLNFDIG